MAFSFPAGRLPRIAAALALLAAAIAAHAGPPCGPGTSVGASCEIALSALHPTQPAVGMIEVRERAARMPADTDFVALTRKHPIPVVQGPDGDFYLTDGHHLARVLDQRGANRVTVRLIGRFRQRQTFWQQMQARHWVYLYDTHGRPIPPSALPRRIGDMVDDPYRSLASYAERAGYFHRTGAYFMEFEWARYFGAHMGWRPIDALHLLPALETARVLACRPEAQALPGYAGPCKNSR